MERFGDEANRVGQGMALRKRLKDSLEPEEKASS